MADFPLGSDVVIWHLRGHAAVVELVLTLARRGRIGCQRSLFGFSTVARRFPSWRRRWTVPVRFPWLQKPGITLSLPDTLIGATALLASIPLYTCNHPMPDLDLRAVPI
jgi:hypothetical protein